METQAQKFTPGPWRNNGQTVYDAKGDDICTCGDFVDDEHKANAELIASAPELIEALQSLYAVGNRCMNTGVSKEYATELSIALDGARRLLSKATGTN